MKKKILTLLTLAIMLNGMSANSVILPHSMRVFLFENEQNTSIRFDGLINLPDGTMYLPVIPAVPTETDNVKIKWTYPANKKMKDKPDIIVLNNNYSLLKVIKDGNKCTIASYRHIPDEIKTGIIPQDLLVPNGFYVSDEIAGLIGNLEVPVVATSLKGTTNLDVSANKQITADKTSKKIVSKTRKKVLKTQMPKDLNDKMYLVTNFDSNYLKVFVPGRAEPVYGLKLKGVLKDAKITPDGKYLITAVFGKTFVDIADISNEQIAKSLELNTQPSEILTDKINNKAYILSTEGKSLFIVDLSTMSVTEKVEIDAVPYRMSLSPDGTQLAYADKSNDTIYILKLDEDFKNIPVTSFKNVSKIITDNNRIYSVSRVTNNLKISNYNLNKMIYVNEEEEDKGAILQKKLAGNTARLLGSITLMPARNSNDHAETETALTDEKDLLTASKPTDLYLFENKLYVLCSGQNKLYVLDTDTLKFSKQIQLPLSGFARKITRIDDKSDLALITDSYSKKYCLINLKTSAIVGTYPVDLPINFITVIKKINNVNLVEEAL